MLIIVSLSNNDNQKRFLVLCEGLTDGVNDSLGSAEEKKYYQL